MNEIIKDHQKMFLSLADKIKVGLPLNSLEKEIIAGALVTYAKSLKPPKKPAGRPRRTGDREELLLEYILLRKSTGVTKTKAYELLGYKYEVDPAAIRLDLGPDESRSDRALAFLKALPNGREENT